MRQAIRGSLLSVALAVFALFCPSEVSAQELPEVFPTRSLRELASAIDEACEKGLDSPALVAEVLQRLEQTPESDLEFEIRLDLSWIASRRGDTDEGRAHADRALELATQAGDRGNEARAHYHRALARWYAGETADAVRVAEVAQGLQALVGDDEERGRTLTLLGAIHRSTGDFALALESHLQALTLGEENQDARAIARAKNNIGLVCWNLDEHVRASEYLFSIIDFYREQGEDQALATVLSNLGLILIELGEVERAQQVLEEGLAIHERLDEPRGRAKLLSNLAFAHDKRNRVEEALSLYAQVLALREDIGDGKGLARTLASMAKIYIDRDRYEDALYALERAREEALQVDAKHELESIHLALVAVYERLGRTEEALDSFRAHDEVRRRLEVDEVRKEIARIQDRERTMRREAEAREQALLLEKRERQRLLLAGSSLALLVCAAAFYLLFRSRARSLAEVRRSHGELEVATERLRESERRYRLLFEDAVVPNLLVDLEASRLLDANEPAAALASRDRRELEGLPLARLEPSWIAPAITAVGGGERCWSELWTDEHGVERSAQLWALPLTLDGRACALVTIHDATATHRLEEERVRADKLESLGRLAGGIAHDFNNALASVLGHVSLASVQARDRELRASLAEAEKGIDHAAHLTRQLLAFASGGAPRKEHRAVRRLLWDTVQFTLSGSNVDVQADIDPELWDARLDAGQFEQVVRNIVLNSVEALEGGGTLRIHARNVVAEDELGPGAAAGPYVCIEFADDGPGIPEALREKVFDPYFTTKDTGSGLGLSTAFAIVGRHAGNIAVGEAPGGGALVTVHFPAAPGSRVAPTDASERLLRGGGRLLVMDDDPAVQATFRAILTELGYEVAAERDGAAALDTWRAARRAGRPFDAVLLDLTIPGGMGGRETLRELLREDPEVIAVVVSGYGRDAVMSNFEAEGFAAALPKPFTVVGLGKTLAHALSRKRTPGSSTDPRPTS